MVKYNFSSLTFALLIFLLGPIGFSQDAIYFNNQTDMEYYVVPVNDYRFRLSTGTNQKTLAPGPEYMLAANTLLTVAPKAFLRVDLKNEDIPANGVIFKVKATRDKEADAATVHCWGCKRESQSDNNHTLQPPPNSDPQVWEASQQEGVWIGHTFHFSEPGSRPVAAPRTAWEPSHSPPSTFAIAYQPSVEEGSVSPLDILGSPASADFFLNSGEDPSQLQTRLDLALEEASPGSLNPELYPEGTSSK